MRLNQRFLAVGFASAIGLGVLAPIASANDHGNRDLAIGLGAASVALLATHNYTAGALGLGLTALVADSDHRRDRGGWCAPVRVEHDQRWRSDQRHDRR